MLLSGHHLLPDNSSFSIGMTDWYYRMDVESQRVQLEQEIRAVEGKIEEAERELQQADNEGDRQYWRDKEKQLRDKEKQLRDKEKQLRDKELLLLQRQIGEAAVQQAAVVAGQNGCKVQAAPGCGCSSRFCTSHPWLVCPG